MSTIGRSEINKVFSESDLNNIDQYANDRASETSFFTLRRSFSPFNFRNKCPSNNNYFFNDYCYNGYGYNRCGYGYYGYRYNNHYSYNQCKKKSTKAPPSAKNSKKKNKTDSGTILAVTSLVSSFFYMIYSIPKMYNYSKTHSFKIKITNLSSKQATNSKEKQLITNLKTLIDSDKSRYNLRNQKIKTLSSMGIFTSSIAYLTAIRDDYPEWIPSFISNNLPIKIPLVSDSLNEKIISVFSNENLIKFSKATAAVSVGALILNGAYNLYQDFYNKNSKSHIRACSRKVLYSVNNIKHGKVTASFCNAFVWLKNNPLFLC